MMHNMHQHSVSQWLNPMLTLKQLTHLNAIVQHGTVHRAAEAIHMTQPALTRSLNKLEQTLGVALFDRSKSGMTPTEFCLRVRQRCEQISHEVVDLKREADLYNNLDVGTINIGVGRAIYELITQQVLPTFIEQYPGLSVDIAPGKPEELLYGIKNRQFELCVAGSGSFSHAEGVHCSPIADINLLTLVRPEHPLLQRGKVSLSELANWPMMSAQTITHSHPLKVYQEQSNIESHVVCSNYGALKKTLLVTDNWLIAPAGQFSKEIEQGEIVQLQQDNFSPRIQLCAIELNGRSRSPAVQTFVDLCVEQFSKD